MPKVPGLGIDAGTSQVQLTNRGVPSLSVPQISTPQGAGAALGAGLNVISDALDDFAQKEAKRELQTLDIEFSNRVRELSYGTPDGGTPGYLSTKNDDAVSGHSDAARRLEAIREELLAKASTPNVRARFGLLAASRANEALTGFSRHALKEQESAAAVASKGRLDNAVNDFATGYSSDDVLNRSLSISAVEVDDAAQRNGITDPEALKAAHRQQTTEVISAGITAALKHGDVDRAIEVLERKGSLVAGPERALLQDQIMTATVTRQAQQFADEIVSAGGSDKDMRQSVRDITKDDRSVRAAEVRDDVMKRINQFLVARKSEEAEADKTEADIAFDSIAADPSLSRAQQRAKARSIKDSDVRKDVLSRLRAARRDEIADVAEDTSKAEVVAERDALKEFQFIRAEVEKNNMDPLAARALAVSLAGEDVTAYSSALARETLKLVDAHITDRRQASRDRVKVASAEAFKAINIDKIPLIEWQAKNPSLFQDIAGDGTVINALQAADANRAKGQLFASVTDGTSMGRLTGMNPREWVDTDLEQLRHRLTEGEYNKAVRIKASMADRLDKAKAAGTAAVRRGETLLRRFAPKSLKWDRPTKMNPASRLLFNQMSTELSLKVSEYVDRTGKPPAEKLSRSAPTRYPRMKLATCPRRRLMPPGSSMCRPTLSSQSSR